MVNVTTSYTAESRSTARKCADCSTPRTSLRRVSSRHFDELASTPSKLVSQHVDKLRPSSPSDATSKAVVLEHALDIELLDDDRAVVLGVGCRQLVQNVLALSLDLAVDATHTVQGFCSVLGSFLSSLSNVLGMTKPLHRFFKVSRIPNLLPVGISEQVGDTSIDSHHRNSPRTWIRNLVLTQDAGKPLISIPSDCASLRLSFKRTMGHDLQGSNLGKVQLTARKSPNFWMRFAKPESVPSLSLPSRLIGQLFEAPLPCLVQLHEQLSTHVARNFRQPWQLSPQIGQLVDLIECCYVLPLVARPGKPDQSLLVGQVPQKPQSALPTIQNSNLLPGRIETEVKTLADEHRSNLPLVYVTVKRVPHWPPCGVFSHSSFGLRAEISEESHLTASLRGTSRSLEDGLCRLRVRTQRSRIRERPRSPAHCIPSQGSSLYSGQFFEGRLSPNAPIGSIARSGREALGRTFLVPFVLRRFVRWGSSRNSQTVRGTTTRRPRFLLSLKGGISARETG